MSDAFSMAGRLPEAAEHAARATELANDDTELSDGLRALVTAVLHMGDTAQAEAITDRLYGVAYATRAQRPMANFAEGRALLKLRTGDLASGTFYESESRYRSAVRAWHSLSDIRGCLRAYHGLANALAASGMYAEALEQVDLGLSLCTARNVWWAVPSLLMDRAFALRDPGLHEAARIDFEDAIAWGERLEDFPSLVRSWMGYMVLLGYDVTRDDLSKLPVFEEALVTARTLAERTKMHPRLIEIHQRAAELYEKIGMHDRAEQEMESWRRVAGVAEGSGVQGYFKGQEVEKKALEDQRQHRFRVRMQETIESIPDALLVLDPVRSADGKLVDLVSEFRNDAADRLFDAVETDVLSLDQLNETPAFHGLREAIWNVVEERTPFDDEVLDEGSKRWYGRRVVMVGDGVAVTFRDLTIEHEAAEALRRAAESARQADHAKSVFLANMSHEVRTPINGVLGLARLLSESELSPQQRSYIEGIVSSADILLGVLGDVLDLSKIEAGRVDLNPEPTDLRALVSRVVGLFAGQASQSGLELSFFVSESVPDLVCVDGTRLRQVLANLVGNAVKFTKSGFVRVDVRQNGDRTRFEVTDTGPGVPEDRRTFIFDAFRQGGADLGIQRGTGLGLTISRRIVEMMLGSIGVESPEGGGSRFWLELPLPAVDDPIAKIVANPDDLSGVRVLLVEDNAVNTIVATGLLNNAGCVVRSVVDGAEAVEAASATSFEVILMDVRMPGMDGLEATRRIRARESSSGSPRTPIVAVTASAFTDDRDECFRAGMDDYLGKPFTAEALRSTLARWTARTT